MAEIYWNPLVPELGVTDVDASLDFYCAAGFSVRFRRDQPPFACLELGGAQLMLEALHADAWTVGVLEPPFGRGINLQVEVESARALYYVIPQAGQFEVTVVLGQRATDAALAGRVRTELHETIRAAKPHVEGRSVKLVVTSTEDMAGVAELVAVKLKPQMPPMDAAKSTGMPRGRTGLRT